MFIKLKQSVDGMLIHVNSEHIALIGPDASGGSKVAFAMGQAIVFKETPEDILAILAAPGLTAPVG